MKKIGIVLLAAVVGLGVHCWLAGQETPWEDRLNSDDLSAVELTELYAERVEAEWPESEARVTGPLAVTVEMNGNEVQSSLENLWSLLQAEPSFRISAFMDHIRSLEMALMAQDEIGGGKTIDRLVPVIKDRIYLDNTSNQDNGEWSLYQQQFAGDIYITFAYDLPRATAFLMTNEFAELDMAADELRELAIDNLIRILPTVAMHGDGEVKMLVADGNYEASLLLADDIWDSITNVPGSIVAVVPSRDALMLTSSESPEGISKMREIAAEVEEIGSYLISQTLLIRKDGQWQVYAEE